MIVIVALVLAWAFLALSRWGRRNVDALVPATLSPARRDREERRLLRGARSLLVLSAICALAAGLEAAALAAGWR
ncbi:MAG TPA: hypothetical protein VNS46_08425 [Nocardioides sp.]|nr:hypothetical protein [Nocardioides sp.]